MQKLYWVLESSYGMPGADVLRVLDHLSSSVAFKLQHADADADADAVRRALDAARQGLEFPDALHWALGAECEGLATFDDKGFARKARKLGLKPAVVMPK